MRFFIILLTSFMSLVPRVRADEISLKNGRVLQGRILHCKIVAGKPAVDPQDWVTMERPYGLIKVRAADIVAIKIKDDDFDRFDALRAEAGSDLQSLVELARWCDEAKLRYRMKEVLAEVLEVEPDLGEAHSLLGEVMTDKGWVKKSAMRDKNEADAARATLVSRAKLRRTQGKMRRLASQIYSQSAAESKRAYLALLVLADAENISGLKPIAARFYRDAAEQREAIASARVTINLQQASVTSLRERSLNLGAGGAVRVQLPETRKIGIGTTVSVPLR